MKLIMPRTAPIKIFEVLGWLDMDGGVEGKSVCDAGCGTGSLTVPLALKGAKVHISAEIYHLINIFRLVQVI